MSHNSPVTRVVFDEYDLAHVAGALAVMNAGVLKREGYETEHDIREWIRSTTNAEFFRGYHREDWRPTHSIGTGGWTVALYPDVTDPGVYKARPAITGYLALSYLKEQGLAQ